jgi:hypothetical protein
LWPIIIAGIAGYFLYHAIKASETLANLFGKLGRRIRDRATRGDRTLQKIEVIQEHLEVATAYLVDDADWHCTADIIIAENYPKLLTLLPARIPFTEFKRRWKMGWRPESWGMDED